jgi:hypothetical protein
MSSPIDNSWPSPPCANINSLEKRKFQEDGDGDVAVNVIFNPNPDSPESLNVPLQNVLIKRVAIALANTEQSYIIPAGTRAYTLRNESLVAPIKWTFTATESGTQYRTLYPGESVEKDGLYLVSKTLYFQSSNAGDIIEIETWT